MSAGVSRLPLRGASNGCPGGGGALIDVAKVTPFRGERAKLELRLCVRLAAVAGDDRAL